MFIGSFWGSLPPSRRHFSCARDWEFIRGGEHDNTLFGLYYTNVGEDKEKNDFMEHITLGE